MCDSLQGSRACFSLNVCTIPRWHRHSIISKTRYKQQRESSGWEGWSPISSGQPSHMAEWCQSGVAPSPPTWKAARIRAFRRKTSPFTRRGPARGEHRQIDQARAERVKERRIGAMPCMQSIEGLLQQYGCMAPECRGSERQIPGCTCSSTLVKRLITPSLQAVFAQPGAHILEAQHCQSCSRSRFEATVMDRGTCRRPTPLTSYSRLAVLLRVVRPSRTVGSAAQGTPAWFGFE